MIKNLRVTSLPKHTSLLPATPPFVAPRALLEEPGQFGSALAHEVRNPLSNINLAVEMLRSTLINNEQEMYLDIITRGSGRISEVVVDLLTYFRADETQAEKHSINELLDEVLGASDDRILLKNIKITRSYGECNAKVFVNRQQLKIAFTNIIINALDAMGPEKGELTIVTRSDKGKCVVEINDNGMGISREQLQTMFEPYVSNKPGGMGLGLSTTRDILRKHHAAFEVRSEEGKGTSFILTFDAVG